MSSDGVVELLSVEDIMQYPEFAEINEASWKKALEFNDRAIVRRRFKPGDVICKEGEYVYTAFYIVSGKVKIFINAPIAHVKTDSSARRKATGFLATMTRGFNTQVNSQLVSAANDQREDERMRQTIPIDATIDLSYEKPVGELGAGELFGEMSCLSFYPRSATVEAAEECVMFEMHRNVLEMLKKKGKIFKTKIDANYKERALASHLRSIPEFASLPDEFVKHLQERVELIPYDKGDVICKQGDVADSMYLVRIGFVRVSQAHAGGDLVLAYLSRGQYFGEVGLLVGGTRAATCTAADHVEVVKIKKEDFDFMVQRFPAVRKRLATEANRRMQSGQPSVTPNTMEIRLEQIMAQGLRNAQNVLLIDLNKCTRCDECVHACADAHEGVTRLLRDGLRFENFLVTTSCRQCTDPVCMIGCPVGSIRRRESLEVIIEDWCIGCDKCVKQCPYGNITMHEFDVKRLSKVYEGQSVVEKTDERGRKIAVIKKATNCDLCIGLDEPSCVYACPHEAAIRVDQTFFSPEEKERKGVSAKVDRSSKNRSRWDRAREQAKTDGSKKLKPWER